MPIDEGALARAGDPVATALALFEEGCLNESIAACEAAEAAEQCTDAATRSVLEIIAKDERRHATMAWRALRWLLQTYPDQLIGPLRTRITQLGAGPEHRDMAFDPRLARYGRLSPQQRSNVRRRVIRELVRPLAAATTVDVLRGE